jgi:hypothetical protein
MRVQKSASMSSCFVVVEYFSGGQECCAECESRRLVIQTKFTASGDESRRDPVKWQLVTRSRAVKYGWMNKAIFYEPLRLVVGCRGDVDRCVS